MRKIFTAIAMSACMGISAQEQDLAFLYSSKFYNDSVYHPSTTNFSSASIINNSFADFNLAAMHSEKKVAKKILGFSKKNKPIEAFYFPGTSNKKALVVGGVHGSELSSVEVAKRLIVQLSRGEEPFYSVIVIPSLFPDNAATAEACKANRMVNNVGRYSHHEAIDPNRQLPTLGTPFYLDEAKDAYGREIEKENQLLLQLIQAFAPERIVNIHAIKDYGRAGVYADPRTDCEGKALGFSSDSALAVAMAQYIDDKGGNAAGNKIKTAPTALYYLDPKPAAAGELQQRNLTGANLKGKISGVSLGSWASTAVCDGKNNYSRPAMRILTMEFPGYKKPSEYKFEEDKKWFKNLVGLYASSVYHYFLQEYCVEENEVNKNSLAQR